MPASPPSIGCGPPSPCSPWVANMHPAILSPAAGTCIAHSPQETTAASITPRAQAGIMHLGPDMRAPRLDLNFENYTGATQRTPRGLSPPHLTVGALTPPLPLPAPTLWPGFPRLPQLGPQPPNQLTQGTANVYDSCLLQTSPL